MPYPVDLGAFRDKARQRLPKMLFEYIDGGANAEVTLRRNVSDLEAVAMRQRVLCDGSQLTTGTELFGQEMAAPIMLAPVGFSGMYARRGEVQAARAAGTAGVPFCLSSVSICGIEEVSRATNTAPWFQLYMIRDRKYMRVLLDRVRHAGVRILVFTVDLPTPGARYREMRAGMHDTGVRGLMRQALQGVQRPHWLWHVYCRGRPHSFGHFRDAMGGTERSLAEYWQWIRSNFDASVTWKDIDWIRRIWDGPLIIKGVLDAEDARSALDHGADGIVVSNHGGRQLDGVRSSISALPAIVDEIEKRIPVMMDGGIRSGLDILKALAMGADGVMVGRAWAYALAADGQRGVSRMLQMLIAELQTAMILTGCNDVRHASQTMIDRDP